MDTKGKEFLATPEMSWRNKPRRTFTPEQRLAMVRQTQTPGVSVAEVAQRNRVNANLLFRWKRQHECGLLPAARNAVTLIPVKRVKEPVKRVRRAKAPRVKATAVAGTIEIELAGVRIYLHGSVSEANLTSTLRALSRR